LKKNVIKLTLCIVITGIFLAGCSGTLQESVTPGSDQSNENIYSSNQEETKIMVRSFMIGS
jgi:PBP1b-binding outer membrane lipoprotein LpoB